MNHHPSDNRFIFNEEISAESITDLYGDDYVYVQEVFNTVLDDYQGLTDKIIACYSANDIQALKAAVHKIKPVFGFVGLIAVQQQCQQFENICQASSSIESVENDFGLLRNKLIASKAIIEEERSKLEIFNNQRA